MKQTDLLILIVLSYLELYFCYSRNTKTKNGIL